MELNEIANRGKLINGIIIGVNLVTFAVYMIGRWADASSTLMTIQTVIRVIGGIIAVACIVYTAILMKNNEGRLKGLGLCLASCIVSLVFSIVGCMIGIVIWVLSGISMKQLDSSFREQSTIDSWGNYAAGIKNAEDVLRNHQENYSSNTYDGYQNGYGTQNNYGAQGTYGGYQDPYGAPQNGGYQDSYGAPQNGGNYQDPFASQSSNTYQDPFASQSSNTYQDPFASQSSNTYQDPFAPKTDNNGSDNNTDFT